MQNGGCLVGAGIALRIPMAYFRFGSGDASEGTGDRKPVSASAMARAPVGVVPGSPGQARRSCTTVIRPGSPSLPEAIESR